MIEGFSLDDGAPPEGYKLRGRQGEWIETIEADLKRFSRLLAVAPGGVGKTTVMAELAKRMWQNHGIRTLVLENRDRLTEQTANRIRDETGLDVDVEKGSQRASPYTPIVVMCVQSGSKIGRLTSFPPGHFGLVIADECHLALSPSWLRIIYYFHFGADSLIEGWVRPSDNAYKPLCSIIGFTASPNLGEKRSLGELFQHTSVNYSFLEAIEEGWLVGMKEVNVPVKIDTRKFRVKRTSEGNAFNTQDQNAAIIPIIGELAAQLVKFASDKKTMAFVPSIEIARLMAEAVNALGLRAIFVSGECIDKNEKTDEFVAHGPGIVLINACLYNYGVDFPFVTCVAIFGAIISKVKYIQSLYRGTRVLPGVLLEGMTQEERLAAIAASPKRHLLVISPFFISDRIDICEPFDMFAERDESSKKAKRAPADMTDPAKIRDYIGALEKAADPHRNKQARMIDPVTFSLSIGASKIAVYTPSDGADFPASKDELDAILSFGVRTFDEKTGQPTVKTSSEAQRLIATLRERERLGLASPKTIIQLTLHLGWPEEKASMMKQSQAGVLAARRVRYKAPEVIDVPEPY